MGQALQIIKPVEGINTDVASLYMKNTQGRYLLNCERSLNITATASPGKNAALITPAPCNQPLSYTQPPGDNQEIGSYYAKRTHETYVFVYNSQANHHIYRINENGTIDVILMDPELNFSLNPRYRIRHIHLYYNHNAFFEQLNKVVRKYLAWTAGDNWQGYLDVETSLATGGFHTPYYQTVDRTQLWQLPTRPPLDCVVGNYQATNDPTKQNFLADNTWEFRIKHIYTDARQTAWSPVSAMLFPVASTCRPVEVQPRCIDLHLDAGGPHVEKIVLAYRNCAGAAVNTEAATNAEWYQADIIDKYAPCLNSSTPFFQRSLSTKYAYDASTNTFLYTFCAEGTCLPIDRTETDRNYINIPKYSFCLAPVENKMALLNNVLGEDPVDCAETAKISLTATPRVTVSCKPQMCKVKIAIIVHNFFEQMNQPVFIYEDVNAQADFEGKQQCFGGLKKSNKHGTHSADPRGFQQMFKDTSATAGFTVYLEGAGAQAQTQQYIQYANGNYSPQWIDNFFKQESDLVDRLTSNDYWFVQVAEFDVIQGTCGFVRVASHLALPTDANLRQTSTTVMGIMTRGGYKATANVDASNLDYVQEIYINTCNRIEADYRATPFIVCDLSWPDNSGQFIFSGPSQQAKAWSGYLTDKDALHPLIPGRPVFGAYLSPGAVPHAFIGSRMTDHNGFYFASFAYDQAWYLGHHTIGVYFHVEGKKDCSATVVGAQIGGYVSPGLTLLDVSVSTDSEGTDYFNDFYQPVTVTLNDADGLPMGGITIACAGARSEVTESSGPDAGKAFFTLRRKTLDYHDPTAPDNRLIQVMQTGVCYLTDENCNACMSPYSCVISMPLCTHGAPTAPPLTCDLSGPGLLAPSVDYGWHPGGIYPVAIKLMDAAGRETAAQKVTSVTTQTVQALQGFIFSDISWNLGTFTAPAEYVRMSVLIGLNRAFDDFVTWVADDVQFVDASGTQAASSGASKVLLSIWSLYDTDTNIYGLGSNVRYSWVKGDRLEIVAFADGTIPQNVMQYPVEADYNNQQKTTLAEGEKYFNQLVIPYSDELASLEPGCQIKMLRKGPCQPAELYWECCQTIDLVQGVPQQTSGTIEGWDTYLVRRGIFYNKSTHDFPFPFLHHSPSDWWGDHCIPRGRVSAVNIYEKRLQFGRDVRLSMTFLENSNYNGLNDFRDDQQKTFAGEQRGDITFTTSMEELFMMVCEHDNFIVQSASEFVRVDQQSGQIVALPPQAIVSEPQSKIVGNYGCRYEDEVIVGDGWVFWVDCEHKVPVFHDWQVAADASIHPKDGSQVTGYFKNKIPMALSGAQLISLGYDCINKCIMVTFFDGLTFVHNRPDYAVDGSETIAFSVEDRHWPTMYSFTPEGYSQFPASDIFISFMKAIPYLHRRAGFPFDNFFGVQCDQVMDVVINEVPEKVKTFLAHQQQTSTPWYSDRLISSLGHTSILPPAFVQKLTEGKWDAHFLMAQNRGSTRFPVGDLYNGPQLRGQWLQVRFIRDNSLALGWNTVDTAKQAAYSEFDRFIMRFALSEQSAFNTNNQ